MPLAGVSQAPLESAFVRADTLLRSGNLGAAKREFASLADRNFRLEDVCQRLAFIAERAGKGAEAIRWLQQGTERLPGSAILHYALGRLLKRSGDGEGAEKHYRAALALKPDLTDAWVSLGILLREGNRPEEAEQAQREALRLDGSNFSALLGLGNILLGMQRIDEAVEYLERAVALQPASPEARNSLGKVLTAVGNKVATPHFVEALRLRPDYWEAAEGLGEYLMKNGAYRESAEAYSRVCELRPERVEPQIKRADAWLAAGEYERAGAEYERLKPVAWAAAIGGLAASLALQGGGEEAGALFEESLKAEPDSPRVRQHYALFLLRHGRYLEGWRNYEAREKRKPIEAYRPLATSGDVVQLEDCKWSGQSLKGRTLLVTCEQGLGDEIMFTSMLPDLIRQAGHVVVECDQRLARLFTRSFPGATVIGIDRNLSGWRKVVGTETAVPQFDCWIQAGSLGAQLRRDATDFPRHEGYLQADPARRARWRERLDALGAGPCIGISWRGGTVRTRQGHRSLSLANLLPVFRARGARFVNLQYGVQAEEVNDFAAAHGVEIHHWQEAIDDYDETAALVSELDLTISVCTAIVHLGGALGCPVWVMAPRVAEWRYGAQGRSMIWYPSVRMYRQSQAGEWNEVVNEVAGDLAVLQLRERSA